MKKKIIIGVIIVIAITGIVAANIVKNKGAVATFSGGKAVDVQVKKIENGNISATISASGVIEESDKKEIYFDAGLKIKKVLVKKNERVTLGQKLVEFDIDSLVSELEQARVSKDIEELAIKKAKVSAQSSGTVSDNNVKSSQLALANAKKDYETDKALFESNAISKIELDKAKKALDDAQIALDTAMASQQGTQGIDVESQEQNLKATLLKISDLENKIKKINDSVACSTNGVIAEVNSEDGSVTSGASPMFRIINPDKLKIKADVKEFDIKQVQIGQDVLITGDAIDKSDGVTGKITSISPEAKKNKTATGDETLIEVEIEIVKSHPVLKPGLTVTCNVITKVRTGVPIVSFEMLREDKDGNKSVIVVDSSNIMHEKRVKLGVTQDLFAEVIEGVNEGENVVEKLQPMMKEGAKANIIKGEKK